MPAESDKWTFERVGHHFFIDDCEECGCGIYSENEFLYDGDELQCQECKSVYYWSCDEFSGYLVLAEIEEDK